MNDIYKVIINSVAAFVALFIISKLSGKKQLAQLEFTDFVVAITIGSIAGAMTVEVDIPFYYFLIAIGIFFVLEYAISFLSRKASWLKTLFNGRPLVLIEEGKINFEELKKSKLDVNELMALCRVEGYFNLNDIAFAIFENNGEISVLPTGEMAPATIKDVKDGSAAEIERASLQTNIIIDGKIVKQNLVDAKKDREWVLKRFNAKCEKELKNIVLAYYDEKKDEITAHYKNFRREVF